MCNDEKSYYKVVSDNPRIGSIINTKDCINKYRVKRNKKLYDFFELVYNYSEIKDVSVLSILCSTPLPDFDNEPEVKKIEKMKTKKSFSFEKDGQFFIDYILEKAITDLWRESSIDFPSRFESSFFFETIEDCRRYRDRFSSFGPLKIVKVDFIEKIKLKKFDNVIISEFTQNANSLFYLNQAKLFLLGAKSEKPQFEIVFQGKYKVISYVS